VSSSPRPAVKVEGLTTLRRTMRQAGVDLQDLKDAHAAVAQTVVRAAAPRTPHRSGKLAASLRGSGQAGAAIVRAGRASVPYAGPIHWGWDARHIKAQPFLWDAIQDSKDQWTGTYLRALQDIIDTIEGTPGP
jgi:hypothetical protein